LSMCSRNMPSVTTTLPLLTDAADGVACCPPLSAAPLAAEGAAPLARAFAALGDPVRLRLMSLLMTADGGQVCACALVEPVGKSQPTVSHHLKVLRDAGLVGATRRGTYIWYAVVPEQVAALRAVLAPTT
jgi:ArsR family transcriptional regulator, arsenate/arsenite/antimonite-responsive transcriptional repressor